MDWKDIAGKIAGSAPLLGSILGSVVPGAGTAIGGAAGAAIKLIASALGCEATPAAANAVIEANPEAVLELQKLEMAHKIELEKLLIEQERMVYADVADARVREKAIVEKTGHSDYNLYALAWMLVVGFFALVATLLFKPLPPDSTGVIFLLFGSLSAAFGAVIQYFFGSSQGSRAKTELMQKDKKSKA